MRFWDTSALVPLLIEERHSALARRLLRKDDRLAVSVLTHTEAVSALCRRRREHRLPDDEFLEAKERLERYALNWREVGSILQARGHAERFLELFTLRAFDALQLAAAWLHVDGKPHRREFVVFDGPLLEAAEAAGFTVIRP